MQAHLDLKPGQVEKLCVIGDLALAEVHGKRQICKLLPQSEECKPQVCCTCGAVDLWVCGSSGGGIGCRPVGFGVCGTVKLWVGGVPRSMMLRCGACKTAGTRGMWSCWAVGLLGMWGWGKFWGPGAACGVVVSILTPVYPNHMASGHTSSVAMSSSQAVFCPNQFCHLWPGAFEQVERARTRAGGQAASREDHHNDMNDQLPEVLTW